MMPGEANKRNVGLREEIGAILRGLVLVARTSPLYTFGVLLFSPVSSLLAPLTTAQLGVIVSAVPGAIAGRDAAVASLRRAVIVMLSAFLAQAVLPLIQETLQYAQGQRYQRELARRTIRAVTQLPGMAHFEDPDVRDRINVASWASLPQGTLRTIASGLGQVAAILGYAAICAPYAKWVPVVLVLAGAPQGVAQVQRVGAGINARFSSSQQSRRLQYLTSIPLDLSVAKEVRVFGLSQFILDRQDAAWRESLRAWWSTQRRTIGQTGALGALTLVAAGATYVVLVRDTLAGHVETGRFVAVSTAIYMLASAVPTMFNIAAEIRRSCSYLPDAFRILDLPRTDPRMTVPADPKSPQSPPSGVRFENVTFGYPRTGKVILDGLDLTIVPGESVAVVGENGAGKTTLVKLLCRFYDPGAGRILLDGVDLREYDLVELRRRLAVIFQDFEQYSLPLRHNIGFGAPAHLHDDAMIAAAASTVGLEEKVREWPSGVDTVLARAFGGVDVSGGEWQRVALARAAFARLAGADLLVLDEPTASLDVRLEHDINHRFVELTHGATTLLISHRFSTVRTARRIVLVENGRVVEDGSHDDLVALGARYAELYDLQARRFRETGRLE